VRYEAPMIWALAVGDPTGPDDDARLCARVAAGDAQALKALYDCHASRAKAVALRVLASASEAEEIVQETFVEVWRHAARYEPGRGSVRAWIVTMARSRAIDRLRHRQVGERSVAGLAREDRPAGAPSPLEDVQQRVERERVLRALAELPDAQRRVIELAYYEGKSQREIAEVTGEPLGTIKTRVRLAMEKLAGLLGGRGGRS
jgi:RNA polymerase sigma-70 factor (ECF subfamily)